MSSTSSEFSFRQLTLSSSETKGVVDWFHHSFVLFFNLGPHYDIFVFPLLLRRYPQLIHVFSQPASKYF